MSHRIDPFLSLTETELRYETRGVLGGGLLRVIPLTSLVGFYASVESTVSAVTGMERMRTEELLVEWREGATLRRERLVVPGLFDSPQTRPFLAELARRCPHADLRSLPPAIAHERLGFVARQSMRTGVILIVVGSVLAVVVIFCVVAGLGVVAALSMPPPP